MCSRKNKEGSSMEAKGGGRVRRRWFTEGLRPGWRDGKT